jgi:hypothetical protein
MAAGIVAVAYLASGSFRAEDVLSGISVTESGLRGVSVRALATSSESRIRGGGTVAVAPSVRAFQIGWGSVDAAVARRAGERRAFAAITNELAAVAGQIAGGAPVQLRLAELTKAGTASAVEWRTVASELAGLVSDNRPDFDLGVWSATARVAAYSDDTKFFARDGAAAKSLDERLSALNVAGQTDDARIAAAVLHLRTLRDQIAAGIWSTATIGATLDSLAAQTR